MYAGLAKGKNQRIKTACNSRSDHFFLRPKISYSGSSGSNSVETKQPSDFVFYILVITLHLYQIVVPITHFKSPFQVVKGQIIYW